MPERSASSLIVRDFSLRQDIEKHIFLRAQSLRTESAAEKRGRPGCQRNCSLPGNLRPRGEKRAKDFSRRRKVIPRNPESCLHQRRGGDRFRIEQFANRTQFEIAELRLVQNPDHIARHKFAAEWDEHTHACGDALSEFRGDRVGESFANSDRDGDIDKFVHVLYDLRFTIDD